MVFGFMFGFTLSEILAFFPIEIAISFINSNSATDSTLKNRISASIAAIISSLVFTNS